MAAREEDGGRTINCAETGWTERTSGLPSTATETPGRDHGSAASGGRETTPGSPCQPKSNQPATKQSDSKQTTKLWFR